MCHPKFFHVSLPGYRSARAKMCFWFMKYTTGSVCIDFGRVGGGGLLVHLDESADPPVCEEIIGNVFEIGCREVPHCKIARNVAMVSIPRVVPGWTGTSVETAQYREKKVKRDKGAILLW